MTFIRYVFHTTQPYHSIDLSPEHDTVRYRLPCRSPRLHHAEGRSPQKTGENKTHVEEDAVLLREAEVMEETPDALHHPELLQSEVLVVFVERDLTVGHPAIPKTGVEQDKSIIENDYSP